MTLKLPILATWKGTFSRWAAEIKAAGLVLLTYFQFGSFDLDPQPTGSMTLTSKDTHAAKYFKVGSVCFFIARFYATVGGVVDAEVTFQEPLPPADPTRRDGVFACWVFDNSNFRGGVALFSTTENRIRVRRYDAGNYTSGDLVCAVAGFYEVNS